MHYIYQLGEGFMLAIDDNGNLSREHTGYPLPDCKINGVIGQDNCIAYLLDGRIDTSENKLYFKSFLNRSLKSGSLKNIKQLYEIIRQVGVLSEFGSFLGLYQLENLSNEDIKQYLRGSKTDIPNKINVETTVELTDARIQEIKKFFNRYNITAKNLTSIYFGDCLFLYIGLRSLDSDRLRELRLIVGSGCSVIQYTNVHFTNSKKVLEMNGGTILAIESVRYKSIPLKNLLYTIYRNSEASNIKGKLDSFLHPCYKETTADGYNPNMEVGIYLLPEDISGMDRERIISCYSNYFSLEAIYGGF